MSSVNNWSDGNSYQKQTESSVVSRGYLTNAMFSGSYLPNLHMWCIHCKKLARPTRSRSKTKRDRAESEKKRGRFGSGRVIFCTQTDPNLSRFITPPPISRLTFAISLCFPSWTLGKAYVKMISPKNHVTLRWCHSSLLRLFNFHVWKQNSKRWLHKMLHICDNDPLITLAPLLPRCKYQFSAQFFHTFHIDLALRIWR